MRPFTDADRRLTRLADDHFGHLTLDQARACGHTDDSARHRATTGRWDRRVPGVFRIAGAPRSWQGDVYAAVIAGPPGTVASYISAAALFGLRAPSVLPHVTVPRGANTRNRLATVHRADLAPVDRTTIGVIPVTTPARTLVDCAAALDDRALREVVDDAFARGLVRYDSVVQAAGRASVRPGRKGLPALREALEVWLPGITHDSVAEARLFRLLAEWGLPAPVALYRIHDRSGRFVCEVDAAWPQRQVGLEYDSPQFHGPRRWERDEARRAGAVAAGWTIVGVDKDDLRPGGHGPLRERLRRLVQRPA